MREMIDQPGWQTGTVDYHLQKGSAFYYRDLEDTVRYLLQQRAYGKHLVFAPIHEFDEEGNRVYTEMNTGDWWWRTQKTLPIGTSLVPPLFMTIGNIHSEIRNQPTRQAWILMGLFPVGPKRNNKIPGFSTKEQECDALRYNTRLFHVSWPPSQKYSKKVDLTFSAETARLGSAYQFSPPGLPTIWKMSTSMKSQPMHNHAAYENLYRAGDLERLDDAGIKPFENALWVQLQVLGIQPPDMVRGDILHNILLGILKHLMGWIEQFLKKHKRLEVFDRIWEQIPPYPGYRPPQKRYRQITMWSGTEMRGINHVILACFTAALHDPITDTPSLSACTKADSKRAIRCVRYITDFCLLAQYRSHIPQTIGYMDLYLRKFHDNLPVFTEFRATKKDHENAKEASRELAADQLSARQAKLDEYFELSATKRTKIATEERFRTLPQYSTEVTEALHKPLKDAYRRSNCVNAAEQILDTITVEHALRMRELNMEEWSQGYRFSRAILDVIRRRRVEDLEETTIRARKPQGPILRGKQASDGPEGTPMQTLAARLGIGQLPERFFQYLRLNTPELVNLEGVAHFLTHYYAELSVKVPEFQGEGKQTHNVQWTAQKAFRKQGQPRADWVWVRRKGRSEYSRGDLDGKIVGKLEGLFSVRDNINRVHEVALVSILRVRGSSRPGRDEGMVRMEGGRMGKE
ncbi:hypothetical protein BGX38DRAFT_1281439 [Terfezia claveryi]|nr:hypothetical protein BGX38DRAFT_1281439 [Terfezia claveryi]